MMDDLGLKDMLITLIVVMALDRYTHTSKEIKLYTLIIFSLLFASYTAVKLFFKSTISTQEKLKVCPSKGL